MWHIVYANNAFREVGAACYTVAGSVCRACTAEGWAGARSAGAACAGSGATCAAAAWLSCATSREPHHCSQSAAPPAVQAAHMPTLLLGTSAAAQGSPAVAAAAAVASAQPHGSVDFWQLFKLVNNGDEGSRHVSISRNSCFRHAYLPHLLPCSLGGCCMSSCARLSHPASAPQAALLAMSTGKEFTIQVQPVASSYSIDVSGYAEAAASKGDTCTNGSQPPQPTVLTLLFRPAGVEPLRQDQPEAGECLHSNSASQCCMPGRPSRRLPCMAVRTKPVLPSACCADPAVLHQGGCFCGSSTLSAPTHPCCCLPFPLPCPGIPAWVRSGSSGDLVSIDSCACALGGSSSDPISPFSALAGSPKRRPDEKTQPYYFGQCWGWGLFVQELACPTLPCVPVIRDVWLPGQTARQPA